MPLPIPKFNENEKEFISRCITVISKEKDDKGNIRWPDNEQRVAVCYSQWENKNESNIIFKFNTILHEATSCADVATYGKRINFNDGYIERNRKKWRYYVNDEEQDSDDDLETLKSRIKGKK